MSELIFNRVEQKYLLTKDDYNNLMNDIKNYIEKDKFFVSDISNIYFDNENRNLIINSIEKEKYKHKVRLRAYDVPTLDSDVYLEIKSKFKDIVNKRRIKIKLKDFYDYVDNRNNNEFQDDKDKNNQIKKEINYLFDYYNLKPFYYVSYFRNSYNGKNEEDLRITFDFNLRSRNCDLNLEKGNYGELFFGNDELVIMEIKSLNSIPLWLSRSLSNNKIFPISISKIGRIYLKKMEELLKWH